MGWLVILKNQLEHAAYDQQPNQEDNDNQPKNDFHVASIDKACEITGWARSPSTIERQ